MSIEKQILEKIPKCPGVYLMKDKKGRVLYVGKAKVLFSRVRSYFHHSRNHSKRIDKMVSQVEKIDCMITGNEVEALVLECNLIKRHKPPFNVILRDDKHYPYIKLTNERFPRLIIVRKVVKDGGTYFGPFPAAGAMRSTIKFVQRVFRIRQSTDPIDPQRRKRRPCLNYQIGLCHAPCAGYISEEKYNEIIKETQLFLKGKNSELLRHLKTSMKKVSGEEKFEEAALLRDQIFSIQKLQEKQSAVSVGLEERDVIVLVREKAVAVVHLVFCRGGKVIADKSLTFKDMPASEYDDAEILQAFISQYYSGFVYFPDEIVINCELDQKECLEGWLSERRGKRVSIITPKKGTRASLISMATQNAASTLKREATAESIGKDAVLALKKQLRLQNTPHWIEAYDISSIYGGGAAVGTKVVFIDGQKEKKEYRRYKIKTVLQAGDVGMMKEVLLRRFTDAIEKEEPLPDLILLDGGRGHVNSIKALMEDLEITRVDLLGIAKGRERNNPETDRIFPAHSAQTASLSTNSAGMRLLQRIRDEAHRFSIEYHRSLRNKEGFSSPLDGIPGVGPVRKRKLLQFFGSVQALREAPYEKVMEAIGVGEKSARRILEHLGEQAQENRTP
ncbi:MAG: excinuclease ABC subunit UvrC [Nitrospinota bacterium]